MCLIANNWTCRRGWDFHLYEAAAEIVECSDVVAPKSQVIPLNWSVSEIYCPNTTAVAAKLSTNKNFAMRSMIQLWRCDL